KASGTSQENDQPGCRFGHHARNDGARVSWQATDAAAKAGVDVNGKKLTLGEKAILMVIAHHINSGNGTAWPSMGTLAREAGCSRRHAIRIVKRFRDGGLNKYSSTGSQGQNVYSLVTPSDTGVNETQR